MRRRGKKRQRRGREGGGFLLHFTGSQFDFELRADTHDGGAVCGSPSPPLLSAAEKRDGGPEGARGDPTDTTEVLL